MGRGGVRSSGSTSAGRKGGDVRSDSSEVEMTGGLSAQDGMRCPARLGGRRTAREGSSTAPRGWSAEEEKGFYTIKGGERSKLESRKKRGDGRDGLGAGVHGGGGTRAVGAGAATAAHPCAACCALPWVGDKRRYGRTASGWGRSYGASSSDRGGTRGDCGRSGWAGVALPRGSQRAACTPPGDQAPREVPGSLAARAQL